MEQTTEREPMERFYFWTYSPSYGWRQMGRIDGYLSEQELRLDNIYPISSGNKFKIMKTIPWSGNND